MTVKNH